MKSAKLETVPRDNHLAHGFALAVNELEERGITREQLAEKLGVKPSTISRWASGDRTVPIEVLPAVDGLCGQPRGHVLRLAGFVDDGEVDLVVAITNDRTLDEGGREALIHMHDVAKRAAARADEEFPDRLRRAEAKMDTLERHAPPEHPSDEKHAARPTRRAL